MIYVLCLLFHFSKGLSLDNLGEYLDKWVDEEASRHDVRPGNTFNFILLINVNMPKIIIFKLTILLYYTPGIYADGFIVFAFLFVRWHVI